MPTHPVLLRRLGLAAVLLLVSATLSQLFAQPAYDPARVEIIRDRYGVPHIYGKTDADAAYGLAWAHCEDDFEHIQINMINARARMGELKGVDGAIMDFFVYFAGIDTLVENNYATDLSPEMKNILEAYAAGFNAYGRQNPEELLLDDLLPVTPQDIVKGYMIPLTLMAGFGFSFQAMMQGKIEEMCNVNLEPSNLAGYGAQGGSNAMAIARHRTADPYSYLLGNSHQPLQGRFAWYEAHLVSQEGLNIVGGMFPGGVSIFVGANQHLGWAHTNNYSNWGDIYLLETKGNKKYKLDGEWRLFDTRKVKIKVKLGPFKIGLKRKIRATVHGPAFKKKGEWYAFRFPAYKDLRSCEQWWRMNKATDFEEFKQALQMEALPMFNVVYADRPGNIFYISEGKYPDRRGMQGWSCPVDGTRSDMIWQDLMPWDKKPMKANPDCGFLFNANNTPLVCTCPEENPQVDFPGLQTFMYNRGDRFYRLLNEHQGPFTWEDFLRIKYDDAYDPDGRYTRNFGVLYSMDPTAHGRKLEPVIRHLQQWNLRNDTGNRQAALARVVHDKLEERTGDRFAFQMIMDDTITTDEAVWALKKARRYMLKHFDSFDIPYSQFLRHLRGPVSLPVDGAVEVPRAMDARPLSRKEARAYDNRRYGQYKGKSGDSYIQFVRFGQDTVILESINCYGASAKPNSPHYTSQMDLFVNKQTKPIAHSREWVEQNAVRRYRPNGLPLDDKRTSERRR